MISESQTDLAPLLERCFLFDAIEDSYEMTGITGNIPEWLRGSYFMNGPARFERAGMRYKHWLDGDGMIYSMRFTNDGVLFTNRFVQTAKLLDEERAGRFLYRAFGTAFPDDRLQRGVMLQPPNNVSVYPYDGRLLAFGEQAMPLELDPVTLETKGQYDFGGAINELTPFAAHAKTEPANGHLVNFGISFSAARPMLNVFEFDARGAAVGRRRIGLQHQHSVHDFGFTPNYFAFYLSPWIMDFQRFRAEAVSVMESLRWEPEKGSVILVVPRSAKVPEFRLEVSPCYCLHIINCFDDKGILYVDLLEMDRPIYPQYQPVPDLFETAPACRPVRFVIDIAKQRIMEKISMTYDLAADFPSTGAHLSGASYDHFWMLGIGANGLRGRKFFDQMVRGSWQAAAVSDKWIAPPGEYLGGEPVAVTNPADPDEAVVLCVHSIPAENRDEFLIFDGLSLNSGPIARLPLKHKIHPGFHASFHPVDT